MIRQIEFDDHIVVDALLLIRVLNCGDSLLESAVVSIPIYVVPWGDKPSLYDWQRRYGLHLKVYVVL